MYYVLHFFLQFLALQWHTLFPNIIDMTVLCSPSFGCLTDEKRYLADVPLRLSGRKQFTSHFRHPCFSMKLFLNRVNSSHALSHRCLHCEICRYPLLASASCTSFLGIIALDRSLKGRISFNKKI